MRTTLRVPFGTDPRNVARLELPACRSAIILTRPEESSVQAADYLKNILGSDAQIIISPALRIIRTGTVPDLAGYSGVVFTSRSGVGAFNGVSIQRKVPAYCVGPRTAAAAGRLGFQVRVANRTSKSLLDLIAAADPGRLLYARGTHVACDVRAQLADRGIEVDEAVVYRQELQPLNPAAIHALAEFRCAVPLFSEMTARHVCSQAAGIPDIGHSAHCISGKVAKAFTLSWRKCVSAEPVAEQVLDSAADFSASLGSNSAAAAD